MLVRQMRVVSKFLLHSGTTVHLPSQHLVDQVRSLVELGKWSANSLETRMLAEHVNALTNIALPTMSAFSEYPSVAEMDVFSCFVNYRFTVSALLDRLTRLEKEQNNLLLHQLLAIVDQYLVNVMTAVQLLQYLVCCPPGMDIEADSSYQEEGSEVSDGAALQKKWCDVRRLVCGASVPAEAPPSPYELYIGMQEHLYPFLQCMALLFRCTTGIQFVHSSATAASNFGDLCKFLSLPDSLPSLLDLPVVDQLVENLCGHPRLPEVIRGGTAPLPLALQPFRKFISLPNDFAELIKKASHFKCPIKTAEGDDGQAAMLCLLCGEMLCTNSLCCQKPLEEDESVKIGGLTQHAQVCGAGLGVALWILESYVVLLDATDLHNVRGCTIATPYIDQYGEADPGLRRGNRLMLDSEQYTDIQKWWWTHQLPGRICHELEHNMRLIRINWSRM